METIVTQKGLTIIGVLVKLYYEHNVKLFFSQDRLILTDLHNVELRSLDVLDFVLDNCEKL